MPRVGGACTPAGRRARHVRRARELRWHSCRYAGRMATLTTVIALVAADEEAGHGFTRPLPMPAELYGIIGLVVGALLLLIVWFWRHSAPVDASQHEEHGSAHGAHGSAAGHGAQHGGHH